MLPELVAIPCPVCQGEGGSYGDDTDEDTLCPECEGSCEVDVCSGCGLTPETKNGLEVCGCVQVEVKAAA